MNLCIDIGNTFVKLAVVSENEVVHKDVFRKVLVSHIKKIRGVFDFEHVVLGASGRLPKSIMRHLEKNYHLLVLTRDAKLPIEIGYKTPETLGRDRVAAVVGAQVLFPEEDNCVIDIGTCITYDVILKSKLYLGGNIAPGVELRLKSMNDYTANLPLVKRGGLEGLIGTTTEEALQNGATIGTFLEIKSFIESIRQKYGGINVILTGGDAEFFAAKIKAKVFVNPDLVLIGLNEIMNFNAK